MTAPRFADCVCGHPRTPDHDRPDFELQCVARGCTCVRYRPKPVTGGQSTVPAGLRPVPQIAHTPPAPVAQSVGPRVPSATSPINIEALLREGKDSSHKNIVSLTERIAVMVADLRGRLQDERIARVERERQAAEKVAARREVAELEKALAAAKAKLRGRTPPSQSTNVPGVTASPVEYVCPECPDTFGTAQGRGAHRAHKHGYRRGA